MLSLNPIHFHIDENIDEPEGQEGVEEQETGSDSGSDAKTGSDAETGCEDGGADSEGDLGVTGEVEVLDMPGVVMASDSDMSEGDESGDDDYDLPPDEQDEENDIAEVCVT